MFQAFSDANLEIKAHLSGAKRTQRWQTALLLQERNRPD